MKDNFEIKVTDENTEIESSAWELKRQENLKTELMNMDNSEQYKDYLVRLIMEFTDSAFVKILKYDTRIKLCQEISQLGFYIKPFKNYGDKK